ncbi:AMP-binding protein [Nonomuraea thailandensis]
MGEVLEVRAEIERQISGRTVCEQLRLAAEQHHDAPAYSDPEGEGWSTLSYGQARERVLEIAAAFVALGLEPGEAVALMMINRSEHVLADLGAVHAGGVGCTVYSTFAPDQIAFVADNVGARYAVLGGPADLARWEPVLDRLDGLRRIIMLEEAPAGDRFMSWADFLALGRERLAADPGQVEARWRAVTPGDVATVLYTSGTTGTPKGVPLTHANIFYEVAATDRLTSLPTRGTQISYLTYAHIAERILSLYLPLVKVSTCTSAPTWPTWAPRSGRSGR